MTFWTWGRRQPVPVMTARTTTFRFLPGILLAPLLPLMVTFGADSTETTKTFTSTRARYTVDYPRSWHVLDRALPTLYVVNFPPSQSVHAVTLPPGGASIAVVPPPTGVLDAEGWATRDLLPGRKVVSKGNVVLKLRVTGTPLDVTEVDVAWESPSPKFEDLDCYFVISGHLLAGRLTYWQGDSRAAEYRQTLHKVIESLRQVGGRSKASQ
jgi:hypothetical protein